MESKIEEDRHVGETGNKTYAQAVKGVSKQVRWRDRENEKMTFFSLNQMNPDCVPNQ